MGILIAMILVATMVGLAYLTQTLGTNATSDAISGLVVKKNQAHRTLESQALVVEIRTDAQDIAKYAAELRLRRLGDPIVLPAP